MCAAGVTAPGVTAAGVTAAGVTAARVTAAGLKWLGRFYNIFLLQSIETERRGWSAHAAGNDPD